uniref:ANK_REP_REGION domain-containing protein n=1 Tax=Macrostomum lignano TaxID=282301 RepID=A0A1I8GH16_9PLAT
MSFNSGGGCEHPFKKLRKKCLSAGCQELIALGDPRCTACSTEDPFDYSCGICGDAAMCDHSNEKCQKTCKNCKTPAKSLGSKFCSECGKQRTFEIACSCQIGGIDNSTQEKSLPYAPEPGQPTKFEIEIQPRMSQDLTTNQPANQPSEEVNNHSSLLPSVKDSGPVNRGTKAIDTDEVKPDEVPEKNPRPTDYLKLVKKDYPNEPLLEVILNCYLDNGSFEFDPGTDRVLIVFKKHELGNDNPAKSPFVFKQECLIDQNHQNTGLSYWRSSFLLPKKLLKDGLEYRYAVEKSSTSTCQEEAGIRLMKHDGTQQHLLQLDALVTSPTPSKTPSRSMDDEYKLQLRLLVDSALDELKRLPPKTVLKAAQARLNDPKLRRKDFQQERMKQEEMERLLSGLCESPDDFGFSTDENRSWEKWLRNIDLFIFLVFNGAITGSANLASGIQQNNLKILLKLILPPIDWKRQTEIARETIADFEEALKIVGEGDVNLLEYLYVAPAYHILLLNVKPWGSDGIDEVYSQIPSITDRNWWGLHRLTDNFCHQIKRLR